MGKKQKGKKKSLSEFKVWHHASVLFMLLYQFMYAFSVLCKGKEKVRLAPTDGLWYNDCAKRNPAQ